MNKQIVILALTSVAIATACCDENGGPPGCGFPEHLPPQQQPTDAAPVRESVKSVAEEHECDFPEHLPSQRSAGPAVPQATTVPAKPAAAPCDTMHRLIADSAIRVLREATTLAPLPSAFPWNIIHVLTTPIRWIWIAARVKITLYTDCTSLLAVAWALCISIYDIACAVIWSGPLVA